jgi:hypothetical protein
MEAEIDSDDSEESDSEDDDYDVDAIDGANTGTGEKEFITNFDFDPKKVERKRSDEEVDNDEDLANEEIFTKFFSHLSENSENMPYILEKFRQNMYIK